MNWRWRTVRRFALAMAVTTALLSRVDDSQPTRDAFLCEVLDAKPTAVTPKFDDYTDGSYHILKEDLLKGVTDEATKRRLGLRGVLIFGPLGLLWSYVVVVFLREGNEIRINMLDFPHARITYKATGVVTTERYDTWLGELRKIGVLRRELPEAARLEANELNRDFAFSLLLSTWDAEGNGRQIDYSQLEKQDAEKRDLFEKLFQAILSDLKPTYDPYNE
jgi:hypothetical protein